VASASVLIVGGGLAGLAAAYHLQRRGCRATIVEARDRIGGRVWTLRDGFGGMHAEAGGDLIDDDQEEIRKLLDEFRLEQTRILREGFFHYRRGRTAQRRLRASSPGWRLTAQALDPLIQLYKLNGEEWQGPIATAIGRQSIAEWLPHSGKAHLERISRKAAADGAEIAATAVCMRNFFLGDPNELSLLTYVEQFAAGNDPAKRTMYRIHGGNDRLPERIAGALRAPVLLRQICRRIVQKNTPVSWPSRMRAHGAARSAQTTALLPCPRPWRQRLNMHRPSRSVSTTRSHVYVTDAQQRPFCNLIGTPGADRDGRAHAPPISGSVRYGTAAKISAMIAAS
jgi:monoamine oxidase